MPAKSSVISVRLRVAPEAIGKPAGRQRAVTADVKWRRELHARSKPPPVCRARQVVTQLDAGSAVAANARSASGRLAHRWRLVAPSEPPTLAFRCTTVA